MPMDVNEPRADHQAPRIDGVESFQGPGGDLGDAVAADAQVAHGIQTRLGVDDPAVGDDEVERLCGDGIRCREIGGQQTNGGERDEQQSVCHNVSLDDGSSA
jgi:hypothetical protein